MHPRRLARRAVGALALLAPLTAGAQSALVPRPTIAAGPIANVSDAPALPSGAFWQAGAEWEQRGGRPAWRLNVEGWRRETDQPAHGAFAFGCDERCRLTDRSAIVGVAFDGKYELTRGRVRPYAASGVGVYRVATSIATNYVCRGPEVDASPTCAPASGASPVAAASSRGVLHALALHAALGASVGVGRARAFTELRLQSDPRGFGAPRHLLPLLFGVRF